MAYKCRICGASDVEHQGDICELCAITQDPYASLPSIDESGSQPHISYVPNVDGHKYGKGRKVLLGGGAALNNKDPYGNDIIVKNDDVNVYEGGRVSAAQNATVVSTDNTYGNTSNTANSGSSGSKVLTYGIVKNISMDRQKKSALEKIIKCLFQGIPFALDDEITMFQVFPDYSGTSLNSSGNACDQVIVYGHLSTGVVAENNDVEVYGHRDGNYNVVASKIINKASGTVVTPDKVIPVGVVWALAIMAFVFIAICAAIYGAEAILWAVIAIICLTNLPLIIKIIAVTFGIFTRIENWFRSHRL